MQIKLTKKIILIYDTFLNIIMWVKKKVVPKDTGRPIIPKYLDTI